MTTEKDKIIEEILERDRHPKKGDMLLSKRELLDKALQSQKQKIIEEIEKIPKVNEFQDINGGCAKMKNKYIRYKDILKTLGEKDE